jgi:hypothetical protein
MKQLPKTFKVDHQLWRPTVTNEDVPQEDWLPDTVSDDTSNRQQPQSARTPKIGLQRNIAATHSDTTQEGLVEQHNPDTVTHKIRTPKNTLQRPLTRQQGTTQFGLMDKNQEDDTVKSEKWQQVVSPKHGTRSDTLRRDIDRIMPLLEPIINKTSKSSTFKVN